LPTLAIASAILAPISLLPAEIVATWDISSEVLIGLANFFTSVTTFSTAVKISLCMLMGSTPAATAFIPSEIIAEESRVAVVVPSPDTSLVLEAASLIIWAPIFSN